MLPAETRKAVLALVQFPQMPVLESYVAREWIKANIDNLDAIDFNVRLGDGLDLGPNYDDATRLQAKLLSQKRADIVARIGDTVTLVEVKDRLSLSAMGQLLGYRTLYQLAHPEVAEVKLLAIGRDASQDVPEVLRAHGVSVQLFPGALAYRG